MQIFGKLNVQKLTAKANLGNLKALEALIGPLRWKQGTRSAERSSAALTGLRLVRHPACLERLWAIVMNTEEHILNREELLEILVEVDPVRALQELGTLREDPIDQMRRFSMDEALDHLNNETLKETGPSALMSLLRAVADLDDSETAKGKVRSTLASLVDEPARLVEALEDEDTDIRRAAAETMATLSWKRTNAIGPFLDPILAALRDKDARVRAAAVRIFDESQDERAVEPLVASLRDEDAAVRRASTQALVRHGSSAVATESLIAALGDEDGDIRRMAAEALVRLHDSNAIEPFIEPLMANLRHDDAGVREAAQDALGNDERAVEPLVAALRDEDAAIRRSAARALARFHQEKAIVAPMLAALADADSGVRMIAADALGDLRDARAVDPLVAALDDARDLVRAHARGALEKLGPLAASAREALVKFERRQSIEALIAQLSGGDYRQRRKAVNELAGLAWASEYLGDWALPVFREALELGGRWFSQLSGMSRAPSTWDEFDYDLDREAVRECVDAIETLVRKIDTPEALQLLKDRGRAR